MGKKHIFGSSGVRGVVGKEVPNEVYRFRLLQEYDHATVIDTDTGEVKVKKLTHLKENFAAFIGERHE